MPAPPFPRAIVDGLDTPAGGPNGLTSSWPGASECANPGDDDDRAPSGRGAYARHTHTHTEARTHAPTLTLWLQLPHHGARPGRRVWRAPGEILRRRAATRRFGHCTAARVA